MRDTDQFCSKCGKLLATVSHPSKSPLEATSRPQADYMLSEYMRASLRHLGLLVCVVLHPFADAQVRESRVPPDSARLEGDIEGLKSPDFTVRKHSFYDAISIGLGAESFGKTASFGSALSRLITDYPASAEPLKVGL